MLKFKYAIFTPIRLITLSLIIYLILPFPCLSQNSELVKRNTIYEQTKQKIVKLLYSNKPDSTLLYINALSEYADSANLPKVEAEVLAFYGDFHQRGGNYDSSTFYFQGAIVQYNKYSDSSQHGRLNAKIGLNYKFAGDVELTKKYYYKSLDYFTLKSDTVWYGFVQDNLGMIYFKQGNFYMALEHIQQALIAYKLLDHKQYIGNEYNTLGIIYRKTNDKDKEEQAYLNAISILEEVEETKQLGYAYNNLSEIYLDQDKIEKALETLEKAKQVYLNTNHLLGLCSYYSVLSYHFTMKQPPDFIKVIEYSKKSMEIAEEYEDYRQYADATAYLGEAYFETGQVQKARSVFEKGLAVAEQFDYQAEIVKITIELAQVYKSLNQPTKALQILEKHLLYKDSISGEEKIKEFTSLDLKFNFQQQQISDSLAQIQKDQELSFQHEKEIQNQKQKQIVLSFIAVLVIIFAIFIFLNAWRNKKQTVILNEKNSLINKALKEKELLLQEVHHRVKNNFQLVSSLLELQSKEIKDTKALESISEGKNRVLAMALIHQKLYQNEDIAAFDFKTYCVQLVNEIQGIYTFEKAVVTDIQLDDIHFDIDTAIPLGLIVNELITNAFKYAFKDGLNNKLFLAITKEKEANYLLVLKDNGGGIPAELDILKTKSLGLRLVQRLTKQLHGTFNYTSDGGSNFHITFKDTLQRKETA